MCVENEYYVSCVLALVKTILRVTKRRNLGFFFLIHVATINTHIIKTRD